MSESIVDYTYEQTQKLVKKNNERVYYAFDRKSYNFFYNVPSGGFYKKYEFQTNGEDVLFNISAFVSSNTSVSVKFNGNTIFSGTFNSYVFVNDCLSTVYSNTLEVSITPASGSVEKLNINFDGELYIDTDKKIFAINGSTVKMLSGDILEFSSLDALKNGVNNFKTASKNYYDMMYKYNSSGEIGDFFVLYDNGGMLTIKNTNTNAECEIVSGVESACFIKSNYSNYELVYVKSGKLYIAEVASSFDSVETSVVTQFESATSVFPVTANGSTGKFIVVAENYMYLYDYIVTDASQIGNNITPIGDGSSATAFYDSNTLYVFSNSYNELKLLEIDCTSSPVKKSENIYKNFVGGFVYGGNVYVYGKNTVLLVSSNE